MRAVLADDSALFREGVARVLADAGFTIVGSAADAPGLLELVAEHRPAVVVTDIRMPPTCTTEGIEAALQIRRDHPGTGVLLLSAHVDVVHAMRLLQDTPSGVGYLLKDRVSDLATFVADVRSVAEGGTVIDPEVVEGLLGRRQRSGPGKLTPRESEVLSRMAQGRSNGAIATELTLSGRTVEANINSIFTKFGLPPDDATNRRVAAVLRYLQGDRVTG
ncbi:MAG: response regulator transcription factor [Mycobacterium sp.]|nr:response regulator transcription factor [Mycobacterium sp.]